MDLPSLEFKEGQPLFDLKQLSRSAKTDLTKQISKKDFTKDQLQQGLFWASETLKQSINDQINGLSQERQKLGNARPRLEPSEVILMNMQSKPIEVMKENLKEMIVGRWTHDQQTAALSGEPTAGTG